MNVITEIKAEAQIAFKSLNIGNLFKYPFSDTVFMKVRLSYREILNAINLQTGEEQHINMNTLVILVPKITLECC